MSKKLTAFERRKMLEARDKGLSDAELKAQFGITDDRTLRRNLKLAEQEHEARLVKVEIIKDALSGHLAEIRALVEQWKEAIVIPQPHVVYPGTLSPTYHVERNPLFGSLREHLPFPTLWRDHSIFASKMDEYLEGCKGLTTDIVRKLETQANVLEVMTLHTARPILKQIGDRAQGEERRAHSFDKQVLTNLDELLLVDSIDVLRAKDALACVEPYRRLSARVLASEAATNLIALLRRLQALEVRIKQALEEILLRRDYIMYTCQLCPGQPRLLR